MYAKPVTAMLLCGALLAPVPSYATGGDGDRGSAKEAVKDSAASTKETVKDSAAAAKEAVKEALIRAKINAKMAFDSDVSALNINVDTDEKGVVILSGTAKSQAEADKAVAIARGVKDVASVKNNITVR